MRRRLVVTAALAAASCAHVPASNGEGLPYLAVFKPADSEMGHIYLLAGGTARLDLSGECVFLDGRYGGKSLPLFYPGTTVGRDARGLFVEDPRTGKFRDGDQIEFGGGSMPLRGNRLNRLLQKQVPQICLDQVGENIGSVNPGFEKS